MAATAPASAPKGAKKAAKKPSVDHPSYDVMIVQAIKALDEKKGCSRQVIVKYIGSNNKVPDKFENRITLALKRMVKKGIKPESPTKKKSPAKSAKSPAKKAKKEKKE